MATVSNLTQYIGIGVAEGYATIFPPFLSVSRPATGVGGAPINSAGLNDVVRLGLATAGTVSSDFTYASGYSGNLGSIAFATASLNICKYQNFTLTDTEILQLKTEEAAQAQGRVMGRRLAADVLSASFAQVIKDANYSNSSSLYTSPNFSSSMAAFVDLDKTANTNNWPRVEGERFLIADTTLWNYIGQNTAIVQASNFGFNSQVAQTGNLKEVFGFIPYVANFTLPNSCHGFACTPNAMALTTVYHQPQQAASKVIEDAYPITDNVGGYTIGYYSYYSPSTRTVTRVFDCLAGVTVLDKNALIQIK